ncbi:hypothetical protein [Candidatus Nanohalovita haloferacivicina]|uniref:hypothetical protein n=1 Tax=Candidatus Nanohalovita haloferacivicina TaxID=2978046 RepID=UPI00325FC5E0|nr:hypothetical protein HBNXNv_0442 [Candidatus Nanohalobia archaeon BNXNv]
MTEKEEDDFAAEIQEMMDSIEGRDVGQKRFQMYEVLRKAVEKEYEIADKELPGPESRVTELKDVNGYSYKLVQDFLTSSSTLEKERKLEKLIEHLKSRI